MGRELTARSSDRSTGTSGGDKPGAGRRPDSVPTPVARQRLTERRDDRGRQALTLGAGQADDLAGGSQRDCEFDGLVEVAPDADVRIVALECDSGVARGLHHRAHHVGARHGERARPAMDLVRIVVGHDRHDLAHAQFRVVQPGIVLALAPDDLAEAPARLQRLADVPERGNGRHEEHGPKARERLVVGTAKIVVLDVGDEECRIADSRGSGVTLARLDEAFRAVDPDSFARRADQAGDLDGAVAESAADVQHALACPEQSARQQFVAVSREPGHEQVLEALELVEQHRIPGFDDDVVSVQGGVFGCHRDPVSSGGVTPRNVQSRSRSYTIFSRPQMTSGHAKYPAAINAPARAGLAADASPRGTEVTLAAAERSAGVTTAMT